MFYWNPQYLLYMAPALLLMLAAQWYVKSTYRKWGQIQTQSGISGLEAAQRIIRAGGLREMAIHQIPGQITDHYDPRKAELSLSSNVYQGSSVASMAIAAHELGHAQQDQEGYFLLRLRSILVPAVNIGSTLGWILIIVGLVLNVIGIAWLGVFAFSGGAIFALATLPVELNASSRAKVLLRNSGIITSPEEERGVNQVLNAAALTYVASLFTAVMQLLYYVSLIGGGRRRR
ncbi:MAG: zinc metallopeptidase [Anaerolineales bacterium]|nr:zinc metallopeptidase [Anaerolineales bacterium]